MLRIGPLTALVLLSYASTALAQAGGGGAVPGGTGGGGAQGGGAGGAAPPATDPKPAAKPEAKDEDAAEEVPVEEVEVEEGPKPDAQNGIVAGKVVDAATKEEIIDGQCTVVGTKHTAVTDAEGLFSLKLPPGTYQLRCFFEGYKTARIDDVVVTAGKKTSVSVKLDPDAAKQEDEVVVEVDPDRTTAATQLNIRRNSANVSDAVSAQDIAKTPDRNAADATRRVVGATVVNGRFVFVRGLGDRYTNSLLNGTPLPSPEPDLQAIPLDIFPVAVLSDITILKTFTPDMPADFAGGSVRIQTKSFPSQFFANIAVTGGYNTQTTFRDRWTYTGSRADFYGLDGGARRIPSEVAQTEKVEGTPQERETIGELFSQKPRKIYLTPTGPAWSVSAVAGDTKNVFDNPLGWIVAVNYGRRFQSRAENQALYNFERPDDPTSLRPTFDFGGTRTTETVSLGGLATLGYQIGKNHRLTTTGMYSGTAEDEVLQFEGFEQDDATTQRVRRSRWVQRQLFFGQLIGEHKMPALGDALLKWNVFLGNARRGEPNHTQSVYQQGVSENGQPGRYGAVNDDGFTHFFSRQTETLRGFGFDWTQGVGKSADPKAPELAPKIKLGTLITGKNRAFDARRFRFQRLRTPGLADFLTTPPEDALNEDSIGRYMVVEENTRTTDTYRANQQIYAGYLMADLPLGTRFRVVGGLRMEHTAFEVVTRDDLAFGNPEISGGFRKTDLLPGVNVVFKVTDAMNLRFAASQTVARPQFREVAPFVYQDFFNAALVYGNPELRRSRITNLDARWEWFASADEVVAASVFYKHFQDPIESAVVVATGQFARTFQNADSARNYGVELEGRKRLSFLPEKLGVFTFLGNVTFVYSRVKLRAEQADKVTSLERPLQGQSPFVVNLALDWSHEKAKTKARLAYNVFGRRIDAIGTQGFPDIYEQPRHTVDLSVAYAVHPNVDLKFTGENLLNAAFLWKQGEYTTSYWRLGQTFWLTAIYTL